MLNKLVKILILLLLSSPVHSQEKIVYLDLDFLFTNSIKGKIIQQELKKIDLTNMTKLKKKENELRAEENKILSQKNILSEEKYNEKVKNFKNKLESFRIEKDNLAQDFEAIRKTKLDQFMFEINNIVEKYVKKESIDLVLNKKHILMGKNNYNISNQIMEILNNQN